MTSQAPEMLFLLIFDNFLAAIFKQLKNLCPPNKPPFM